MLTTTDRQRVWTEQVLSGKMHKDVRYALYFAAKCSTEKYLVIFFGRDGAQKILDHYEGKLPCK